MNKPSLIERFFNGFVCSALVIIIGCYTSGGPVVSAALKAVGAAGLIGTAIAYCTVSALKDKQ